MTYIEWQQATAMASQKIVSLIFEHRKNKNRNKSDVLDSKAKHSWKIKYFIWNYFL